MPDARKVFVVHGRNEQARVAMFDFLRALDLRPLEFSEVVSSSGEGSPFVGQAVDSGMEGTQAIVVLLTGDVFAQLRRLILGRHLLQGCRCRISL